MALDFACIDVETANQYRRSICQVGVVTVKRGMIIEKWGTLVNPEEGFNERNTEIHGISSKMVQNAPTFPTIYGTLQSLLGESIVVSHTTFDQQAIDKAIAKYECDPIDSTWLDSIKIARNAWPGFKQLLLKKVSARVGNNLQSSRCSRRCHSCSHGLL